MHNQDIKNYSGVQASSLYKLKCEGNFNYITHLS